MKREANQSSDYERSSKPIKIQIIHAPSLRLLACLWLMQIKKLRLTQKSGKKLTSFLCSGFTMFKIIFASHEKMLQPFYTSENLHYNDLNSTTLQATEEIASCTV